MRSKNYTQVQARFDFEERVEDKNESIELYETICNTNENKVEQEVKLKLKRDMF